MRSRARIRPSGTYSNNRLEDETAAVMQGRPCRVVKTAKGLICSGVGVPEMYGRARLADPRKGASRSGEIGLEADLILDARHCFGASLPMRQGLQLTRPRTSVLWPRP